MKLRIALVAGLLLAVTVVPSAGAHAPNPVVGGQPWAKDQVVAYAWRAGQVPPAWMVPAIDAAAADVNRTRASRAATFVRAGTATSLIAYGEPTGCSSAGIACFSRADAPNSFRMWFRAHGFQFDWGQLRWCQALAKIANGCFDVENIALDEFGHVEILGHHQNLADGSDFEDSVVQTVSRARPAEGWDAHDLGRCDVARLQLVYERPTAAALFSTCLAITTSSALSATDTSISAGDTITVSATLRAANLSANGALANDLIASRTVTLQRRVPGTTAWTSVGTMVPSATSPGTYASTVSPTATYEWRASFATPTDEGLIGSGSAPITVTVWSCSGACGQSVEVSR